jgi:ribosomal protein S18 acetylase RimI-like enzyme
MAPSTVPAGKLGNLLTQDFEGLQPLLAEEADVLWRTLRWQVEPWGGPTEGLTWVAEGKVLAYLPLRISGDLVIVGRLFATRSGPVEAVEAALLDAAIGGAFSSPLIRGVFGELLGVAPATLVRLRSRGPAQVRLRSLMEVTWTPPGRVREPSFLEPWHEDHLAAVSDLLWRSHAAVPDYLPDPAFNNRDGIAFLLKRTMTRPVCGRFEPGASFVARASGSHDLLGFALASRMGEDQGHLIEVAVEPGARRRGIGKALVTRVLDGLRELGCRTTHLIVNQENPGAVTLYQSLGFRECHQYPDLRLKRQG